MFPKDELRNVYVLITIVCFAFHAALKDIKRFYKLWSLEKDGPSVGFVTCGSHATATDTRVQLLRDQSMVVKDRAVEKNRIRAATVF